MVKFSTVGVFRNAVTFPNIKAGPGGVANFSLTVPDQINKITQLPTSATAQGRDVAIIMQNFGTLVGDVSQADEFLPEGAPALCVCLESVIKHSLDIDSQHINGNFDTVVEGDFLVADTDGNFTIIGSPSGYAIYFLVTDIIGPIAKPYAANRRGGVRAQIILAGGGSGSGGIGPQGPQGIPGPPGATGPQGLQGLQGEPGSAGVAGAVGPQGEVGPAGATGAQGIQGETGAIGPTGDTGPQGPAGAQGEVGPQGIQGVAGEVGPTGAQGEVGATGPAGADGTNGTDGADGETPELRTDDSMLQYRFATQTPTTWTDLYDLSSNSALGMFAFHIGDDGILNVTMDESIDNPFMIDNDGVLYFVIGGVV